MNEKLKLLVVYKDKQDLSSGKLEVLGKREDFDVNFCWKNEIKKSDINKSDFVISVGGDGTALSASHYLFEKPILFVNSDPEISVGAITTSRIEEIDKKLDELKNGEYKIDRLERIEVFVNSRMKEPLALNEVFIANEKAYHMSKYEIKIRKGGKVEAEKQFSSGIIFSTGTGSTAWFKSAGGEQFSPQERFIKMIVREPYVNRLNKFSLMKKTIDESEEIKIIPSTPMILAIDSIREFRLKEKDEVKIKISKHPLLRIK